MGAGMLKAQLVYECADDGGEIRLDVLAANGEVVRLGHEFLIRGTQSSFDKHVARGVQYAEQHSCTVYVVNIVFTDGTWKKNVHLPQPDSKAGSSICWFLPMQFTRHCVAELRDL